jgi:hypothetical protein
MTVTSIIITIIIKITVISATLSPIAAALTTATIMIVMIDNHNIIIDINIMIIMSDASAPSATISTISKTLSTTLEDIGKIILNLEANHLSKLQQFVPN